MEDSYEFDHSDYKGQPWHLSTSITFTMTDKGSEITLAKANTEEYLELPKESFASFNKHFGPRSSWKKNSPPVGHLSLVLLSVELRTDPKELSPIPLIKP